MGRTKSAMAGGLGVGVTALGVGGALLFFNSWLLSVGNLLFVAGVVLTFGLEGTVKRCLRKGSRRGTVAFFVGLFLIRNVSSFIGFLLQCYAIFLMLTGNYRGFLATLVSLIKLLPIVGPIFDAIDDVPWVKKQLEYAAGKLDD